MRVGVFSDRQSVDEIVTQAQSVRALGYHSYWLPQIFGPDALTALAVVGHEVPDIGLGTGVVPTYPRHPLMLAGQARTVQQASAGRLTLGIGLSHKMVIENMFGMSFDKPVRHMREYLEVLVPLLRGEPANVDGEVYQVHGGLMIEATPVPVVVAALGTQMLKVAGRIADGTATWMTGTATVRDHVTPTIRAAADEAGNPEPQVVVALPTCVTADPDEARKRAANYFSIYGQLPSYRAMLDREGAAGPEDVAIIGTQEQVLETIAGIEAAGATEFIIVPFFEREETLESLTSLVG